MEDIKQMIENLGLDNQLTLEDIPHIDLYIDQVIQLFEKQFANSKRNEEEKVLTKTMVNNYAKGKLFIPIKNKKYSKNHLMLINLIYQLKGALSINDIKKTLLPINKKLIHEEFQLDLFYQCYLQLVEQNIESFKKDVEEKAIDVKYKTSALKDDELELLQKILLIISFANMSNFYRRAAEKLIDEFNDEGEKKKN